MPVAFLEETGRKLNFVRSKNRYKNTPNVCCFVCDIDDVTEDIGVEAVIPYSIASALSKMYSHTQ